MGGKSRVPHDLSLAVAHLPPHTESRTSISCTLGHPVIAGAQPIRVPKTANTDYLPGWANQLYLSLLVNFLAIPTFYVILPSGPRKEHPYPGKGNKEVEALRL